MAPVNRHRPASLAAARVGVVPSHSKRVFKAHIWMVLASTKDDVKGGVTSELVVPEDPGSPGMKWNADNEASAPKLRWPTIEAVCNSYSDASHMAKDGSWMAESHI